MKFLVALALILATSYATLSDFTLTSTFGSTTAGWTITGGAASELIGAVLADLGDFNGDGYADYAIATQTATPKVYIILGKSGGRSAALDLGTASASDFLTLTTAATANEIGAVTALAGGDVNGDGVPDLAIGMSSVSRVYVIYGATTTTWGASKTWPYTTNFVGTITGEKGFKVTTTTVAFAIGKYITIADFADDTKYDLILGAPDWTDGTNSKGAICVVFGKTSAATDVVNTADTRGKDAVNCESTTTLNVAGTPTYEGELIIGASNSEKLGKHVAAGVDLNADGFEDIVTTSVNAVTAYIIYGSANRVSARAAATDITVTASGVTLTQPAADSITSLNVVGDYNGDSRTDVAFGYPSYSSGGSNNLGRVFVLFGQSNSYTGLTPPLVLTSMDAKYGISITGKTVDAAFGQVVDGADVNKDGIDDLLISAPLIAANRADNTKSGHVHIFYGSKANTASVDLATATQNGITITGVAGTGFGTNLASLGRDVSGDSVVDFIVSAPGSGTDKGVVYELRGQAITPKSGFRLQLSVFAAFASFLVALMF